MVFAKYTENLYESEVYRELERQAVRKGHFNPSPAEQVKIAAAQINKTRSANQPVDAIPSDDLIQDIARLAFAMRRKGYVDHAEDLEKKLILYKQAESALYNVSPESNAALLQFSHRDGDVEIIEGAGEPGTIETIESIAKKIRQVAEKQPTGKLPGKGPSKTASLTELAALVKDAGLHKKAQDPVAQTRGEIQGIYNRFEPYRKFNIDPAQYRFDTQGVNWQSPNVRWLYDQAIPGSAGSVSNYMNILKMMGKAATPSYDDLVALAKANPQLITSVANALGASIGTQEGPSPVSGYETNYARVISDKLNQLAQATWSAANYSKANQWVQAQFNALNTELGKINITVPAAAVDAVGVPIPAEIFAGAKAISDRFAAIRDGSLNKQIVWSILSFLGTNSQQVLTEFWNGVSTASAQVTADLTAYTKADTSPDVVRGLAGQLNGTIAEWREYSKTGENEDKVRSVLERLNAVVKVLNAFAGGRAKDLIAKLEAACPWLRGQVGKTVQDLQAFITDMASTKPADLGGK
jgi:hypothetical protein